MIRSLMMRHASAVVIAVAIVGVAGARAADCTSQKELAAYSMRQLQTDLMVASLSCGEKDRYNAFIGRFKGVLAANGKALKNSFHVRFGDTATAALNRYVTALANLSALDSISAGPNYCALNRAAFDSVMKLQPRDLEPYANAWWNVTRKVPETDCRAQTNIASTN